MQGHLEVSLHVQISACMRALALLCFVAAAHCAFPCFVSVCLCYAVCWSTTASRRPPTLGSPMNALPPRRRMCRLCQRSGSTCIVAGASRPIQSPEWLEASLSTSRSVMWMLAACGCIRCSAVHCMHASINHYIRVRSLSSMHCTKVACDCVHVRRQVSQFSLFKTPWQAEGIDPSIPSAGKYASTSHLHDIVLACMDLSVTRSVFYSFIPCRHQCCDAIWLPGDGGMRNATVGWVVLFFAGRGQRKSRGLDWHW